MLIRPIFRTLICKMYINNQQNAHWIPLINFLTLILPPTRKWKYHHWWGIKRIWLVLDTHCISRTSFASRRKNTFELRPSLNHTFHYRHQKRPPLDPTLIPTPTPYFLHNISTSFPDLSTVSPRVLFLPIPPTPSTPPKCPDINPHPYYTTIPA
jgi:hypothetical protein